jgi:hypothetical protein
MKTEPITRLDAAKLQMVEAIRLFFEHRPPVVVHTLVAACAQVLSDLCKAKGILSPLRGGDIIRPERRKEILSLLKRTENLLKHANHDPDAVIEFDTIETEMMLLGATRMYTLLAKEEPLEAKVFLIWCVLRDPDLLEDYDGKRDILALKASHGIDPNDFEFFSKLVTHGKELQAIISSFPGLGMHARRGNRAPQ